MIHKNNLKHILYKFNIQSKISMIVSKDDIKDNSTNVFLNMNDDLNIGNVNDILDNVNNILKFISSNKKLEKNNRNEFMNKIKNEFSEFQKNNKKIFDILLNKKKRKENVKILINMLDLLIKIKSKKISHDDGFDKFKENLINNMNNK